MPDPPRDDELTEITMTLPARASYARIVRLGIAALASRRAFSYDDIEDLRIAVAEAFGLLVDPVGRVEVRCLLGPDSFRVELDLSLDGRVGRDRPEVTELTERILRASVDQFNIDEDQARVRLVKRRH